MRRSEWSNVKAGDLLNLRVENYAYSGKPHPRTAAELEALAALFGDRFEAVRDAPWQFVSKTTETGREYAGGCLGVVVSTVDDVTIRVHRNDLHVPRPPVVFPAPRTLRVVTPHPEPAKCDPPSRKPWADNQRVGSIYVEQEPGGTVRVSLVMTVDGVARQVQSSTGLQPEDVAAAVEMCGRRLTAEAQRRATAVASKAVET